MEKIYELIKKYPTIIIHRHLNPDYDALGSQIGLKEAIKNTYPKKEVFVVGDINKNTMLGEMDLILDDVFKNALIIVLDVAVSNLVSDKRFLLGKEIIIIDHHHNDCDILGYLYKDIQASATAEIIADFVFKYLKINGKSATALFSGIITDTNRFMYQNVSAKTYILASKLIEAKADSQYVYNNLYIEPLESRKMKNYFSNNFIIEDKIAYLKNDESIYLKYQVDPYTISRGLINLMAGIDEIKIWANFTFDPDLKIIICELRSREIIILDIAKKYGGGGHQYACGAKVTNWEIVSDIIQDLKERRAQYD